MKGFGVVASLLWSSASALRCGPGYGLIASPTTYGLTASPPLAVRMQAAGSLRAEIAEKMLEPFRSGGEIGIYTIAAKKMKPAFAEADVDGDGFIDAAGLQSLMSALGEDLSEEELAAMMSDADTNGDGKIEYGDWTKNVMFKKEPAEKKGGLFGLFG